MKDAFEVALSIAAIYIGYTVGMAAIAKLKTSTGM